MHKCKLGNTTYNQLLTKQGEVVVIPNGTSMFLVNAVLWGNLPNILPQYIFSLKPNESTCGSGISRQK